MDRDGQQAAQQQAAYHEASQDQALHDQASHHQASQWSAAQWLAADAGVCGAGDAPAARPARADEGARGAAPARQALLVLGMHRSGTSALVRLLASLGAGLPATLEAANPTNALGHWESARVREFNEALLAAAGSHWADWAPIAQEGAAFARQGDWLARAGALLAGEYGDAPLFALKDPRNCRLAGFWLAVLRAQGCTPLVLLPLRHPQEVAASLTARDGIGQARGMLLWLSHVLAAESASRGCRRLFTTYAQLLEDAPGLAARAGSTLGVAWPVAAPAAGTTIDPGQRHHFAADPPAGWVGEVFEVLSHWAEAGENARDYPRLDAVRAAMAAAAPVLAEAGESDPALAAALVSARAEHIAESKALHARVHEEQCRLAGAEAALLAARQELEAAREWVLRLAAERAAAEAAARRQALQAGRDAQALADARREARRAGEDLASARAQLASVSARVAVALEQAEAQAAAAAEARRAARAAEASAQAAEARLDEAFAQSGTLSALLQRAEAEAADHAASAQALQQQRDEARALLAGAADEQAQLQQQLAALRAAEAEGAALRGELAQATASLAERFDEIAALSRLMAQREAEARLATTEADWLREVAGELARPVPWWAWPAQWWRARRMARLARRGLFDARFYHRQHPDVAASGYDPLWHYILHGRREGRAALAQELAA